MNIKNLAAAAALTGAAVLAIGTTGVTAGAGAPSGNGSGFEFRSTPVTIDPALRHTHGTQRVLVRLSTRPVAALGGAATASAQRSAHATIAIQQAKFIARASTLPRGAHTLGQLSIGLNGVLMTVDAADVATLAAQPGVVSVSRVHDYEMDLSETVPYIGATTVHTAGFTGAGITVAVLDSGIDYTHAEFGGGGTVGAYAAAYGVDAADPKNTTTDGLFPTSKVIRGRDFVGESWPNTPTEQPDDDPIDAGGHGTHVADIIAGVNGVAPRRRCWPTRCARPCSRRAAASP